MVEDEAVRVGRNRPVTNLKQLESGLREVANHLAVSTVPIGRCSSNGKRRFWSMRSESPEVSALAETLREGAVSNKMLLSGFMPTSWRIRYQQDTSVTLQ